MFLSSLVSRLDPDGSLVVDLADAGGPLLRFGPVESGMAWYRWERDRWVGTDQDYGVLLVNQAHETRRDLPVLRYLAGLPRPVIQSLFRIRHLQATVLQLHARWGPARDLAGSNLPLLWLAAECYAHEPWRRHLLVAALDRPQRALLGHVLGREVRPAQVRFLRKVVLDSGSRSTLVQLRRIVADEQAVTGLRHWPRIPAGLFGVLAEAPYVARLEFLRTELQEAGDDHEIGRILRLRRGLLRDTARMADLLRAEGGGARILTRCRNWARVQALHERLIGTLRTLGWESALHAGVNPAQALSPPPIPSSPGFTALETVAELIAEGERMHHCVVTRATDALAGRAALYRVDVAGECGTLEVSMGPGQEPLAIEDFRLACNVEPSVAAWEAANRCFFDGRRAWERRSGEGPAGQ